MEWFDTDVSTMKPTLQETPKVFESVRVNLSTHVALGMVNDFTNIVAFQFFVREQLVGEYFGFWYNMLPHDVANCRSTAVFSNASANVPATFEDSQNHSFVRHSEFMSTFIFVDVT